MGIRLAFKISPMRRMMKFVLFCFILFYLFILFFFEVGSEDIWTLHISNVRIMCEIIAKLYLQSL